MLENFLKKKIQKIFSKEGGIANFSSISHWYGEFKTTICDIPQTPSALKTDPHFLSTFHHVFQVHFNPFLGFCIKKPRYSSESAGF